MTNTKLKIEAGKRYVCRDGGISGVIEARDPENSPYPWCDGDYTWTKDGLFHHDRDGGGEYPADLIHEYIEPQSEWGPWIGWNGGECPVDGNDIVQTHQMIDNRYSAEKSQARNAAGWNWLNDGTGGCIIAYRVKEEPETVENQVFISNSGISWIKDSAGRRKAIITTKGDDIAIRWAEE